ncbi:MAG: DUF4430 domain-containing protein [Candidatus Aenigmarchaeota archaeon]|nr:DUF4430 domain-containing protein [Candidatus Aenigmarchaeota archaeon]
MKVSSYDIALIQMETAFDALKHVAAVGYEMKAIGIYITDINGIKQDDSHYWFYYVNDKASDVGSDFYYPVSGDVIKFKFMSIYSEEAGKYFQ